MTTRTETDLRIKGWTHRYHHLEVSRLFAEAWVAEKGHPPSTSEEAAEYELGLKWFTEGLNQPPSCPVAHQAFGHYLDQDPDFRAGYIANFAMMLYDHDTAFRSAEGLFPLAHLTHEQRNVLAEATLLLFFREDGNRESHLHIHASLQGKAH